MANFNTYTTKEADFFHSEPDARRMQLAELKDRVQNREGVRKEDFDGPSKQLVITPEMLLLKVCYNTEVKYGRL